MRSISRNKLFATVNILGLTIGFFASTLIYLYVQGELDYDKFHEHGDRIYRINQTFIWGEDNPNQFSSTGPAVAYAINEEIPEVEQVVRVHTPDVMPITFEMDGEQKFFKDELVFAADSNFFEFFSFPLKYGDPNTALESPKSVVLRSETAIKFFGDIDPVGQIMQMDGGESYKVTGVIAEGIPNSYLDEFDVLISLSSFERMKTVNDNWMWTMFETYIMVEENVSIDEVTEKIQSLPEKYAVTTLDWMGYTYNEYIAAGKKWDLFVQPLGDIYIHSENVINRLSGTGDMKIVIALTGSAIFLIILSCINFINLSTAQFTSKAKDIALRKVLGVSKIQISKRFLSESFFYCIFSAIAALFFVQNLIPSINQSLGTNMEFVLWKQPEMVLFVIGLIAIISLITGFYPFTFFNAFEPAKTLKGEMKTGKKGVAVRNSMLVTQYVLSFILIICSFTVFDQLNYFMNKDLGFKKENLITLENVHWTSSPENFVNELNQIDGVESASFCDGIPLLISNGDQFIPDEPDAGSLPLNYVVSDENYLETIGLELIVGRGFDSSYPTDSTAVILNEIAAESIGWSVDESILNKKIENWSGKYHVIGVVKDFNYWSLYAPIEPFAIFNNNSLAQEGRPTTRAAVRLFDTDEEVARITTEIESKWEEFATNRPFEMTVLEDHYRDSYSQETQFRDVLSFFSLLTIIIASLGLFGIVVFSIEQKLKEIGVRKVLGASVSGLVVLFSRAYVKLLLIAFLIAAPAGYFFMENWLSGFSYRIQVNPLTYASAFVVLLVVTLAISIFHTTRASLLNPSEVLKDE